MATSHVRRHRVLDLSCMEEFFRDIEMRYQVPHVVSQAPRSESSSETSSELQPEDYLLDSDEESSDEYSEDSEYPDSEDSEFPDSEDSEFPDSEDSEFPYRVFLNDSDNEDLEQLLQLDGSKEDCLEDEILPEDCWLEWNVDSLENNILFSSDEDSEDEDTVFIEDTEYYEVRPLLGDDWHNSKDEFVEVFSDGREDELLSDERSSESAGDPDSDLTSYTYSSSSTCSLSSGYHSMSSAEIFFIYVLPSDESDCEPESDMESITYSSSSSIDSISTARSAEDAEATVSPQTQRAQNGKKKNIFRRCLEFFRKVLHR